MTFEEELEAKGFNMNLEEELIKSGAQNPDTGEIDFQFTDLELWEFFKPFGYTLKEEYQYLDEELKNRNDSSIEKV